MIFNALHLKYKFYKLINPIHFNSKLVRIKGYTPQYLRSFYDS